MKVYTVTYLINNYGSILQAFALQTCLKEFGVSPFVILRDSNHKASFLYTVYSVLRPVKHYSLMQRIKKRLHVKRYAVKNKKLKAFIDSNIGVTKVSDTSRFLKEIDPSDIFLAGSDQIWSMAMSPLSQWYTLEWVNGVGNKKYSYAASIGLDELREDQKKIYFERLSSFEMVSLREKQAVQLLKTGFKERIRQDLDPTLLFDGDFWRKIENKRLENEPYIFVYMLRPDTKVIKLAKRIAKEKGYKVVYTGLLADHYHGVSTICDAGISEFLSYIDHAELVIANSFHGTVFSVLFEKPFLSVKVESTSSRVESFLDMTGLMSQYVVNTGAEYCLDVDFTKAKSILDQERLKSRAYLQSICSRAQ